MTGTPTMKWASSLLLDGLHPGTWGSGSLSIES